MTRVKRINYLIKFNKSIKFFAFLCYLYSLLPNFFCETKFICFIHKLNLLILVEAQYHKKIKLME
jgi:hypothetical protein